MTELDIDAIEARANDLRSLARREQIFAPEMTVPHLCSDIDALIARVRELESMFSDLAKQMVRLQGDPT